MVGRHGPRGAAHRILSAAGATIGLSELSGPEAKSSADTISIVGGALLLLVLLIAYFAGGYVAGGLSRFDGARQGIGAWLFGIVVALLLAAAGAIFGSEYNVLQPLDLPRIPVDEGSLATGGLTALALILIGTFLAAFLGGQGGQAVPRKSNRPAWRTRRILCRLGGGNPSTRSACR